MIKTFLQRAISYLPRSDLWNGLFQRYVTRGLHLDLEGEFRGKLNACRQHLDLFQANCGKNQSPFKTVELGTGWFPILPIGFYLCGTSQIWTYDLVRLLQRDTFQRTLECFLLMQDSGRLVHLLPFLKPERVEALRDLLTRREESPEKLLERLGIYAVVADVRSVEKPERSIDFVFSNGVLEHLPRRHLVEVFGTFRRWLNTSGVMSHHIGMADQFASFDRSITPFNFLRYSSKSWSWLDNRLIPQNRLRHSDYLSVIDEAGFDLISEDTIAGRVEDLRSFRLAPEFKSYSEGDLAILESWLVAKPRPAQLERRKSEILTHWR